VKISGVHTVYRETILFASFVVMLSIRGSPRTMEKQVDKTFLQKLVDEESDRVAYSTNKGKSDVWQHFVIVLLDGAATAYVKCSRCNTLRWQSRDGTNSLRSHSSYCATKKPQAKITCPSIFSMKRKTVPASVKSAVADQMVTMCAKDVR